VPPWADALACAKGERDYRRVVDARPWSGVCCRAILTAAAAAATGWQKAFGVECLWVWVELWVMQDPPEKFEDWRGGCYDM